MNTNKRKKIRNKSLNNIETDFKVILEILEQGALTRVDLCKILGLSRTTVLSRLNKLFQMGKVIKTPKGNRRRGRPVMYWTINKGVNNDSC